MIRCQSLQCGQSGFASAPNAKIMLSEQGYKPNILQHISIYLYTVSDVKYIYETAFVHKQRSNYAEIKIHTAALNKHAGLNTYSVGLTPIVFI